MPIPNRPRAGIRLHRETWKRVIWHTALHTSFAVLASVAVCTFLLDTFSAGIDRFGMAAAVLAPLLLGAPMIFIMSYRQQQLEHAYAELASVAARDSLTGCLNHGGFVSLVTAALDAGQGGTLLVIDADHFKTVNDRFGHAVGDTALQAIASAIRDRSGEDAIVGRLGGEEFGVFAPVASPFLARLLCETIRSAVEAIALEAPHPDVRLTVSIGGTLAQGGEPFGQLFRVADAELYAVKEAGRNAVRIASPADAEQDPLRVIA